MKQKIIGAVLVIIAIIGIILIAYPFVSIFINNYNSNQVVVTYDEKIDKLNNNEIKKEEKKAENYNKRLTSVEIEDPLDKQKQKKSSNTKKSEYEIGEQEGYIVIPAINLTLPIYEGVTESVLTQGVGHLPNTSMPFGGKGTHCVLTGHTGLENTEIFDNIDKLKLDDTFYIRFLNKTIEYKVDNINIVLPDDINRYISSNIESDYCTLVTCTPRTINSHRLLVRGHRIKYDGKDVKKIAKEKKQTVKNISYTAIIAACVIFLIIITGIVLSIIKKRRRKLDKSKKGKTEPE